MKRSMAAALIALTALLCACAAQPQWETVGDGCTQAATGEPGVIYVHLPADAVEEVFSERGAQHVYTQPDGGYEITAQTMPAAPSGAIVRQLSGFDEQALHVYETTAGGRTVWQFAWYAGSDEGGRLYRAKVINDGAYCYALTFSAPERSGTSYDTTAAELFSSMEVRQA